MNTQKNRSWEVRLSAVQTVIILGFTTGMLAAAFYLGFASGQHIGFEAAQHAAIADLPKIPIPPSELEEGQPEEIGSDVFAKLTTGAHEKETLPPKEMPELGEIKDVAEAPIVLEDVKGDAKSESLEIPSATTQRADSMGESLGTLAKKDEVIKSEPVKELNDVHVPVMAANAEKLSAEKTILKEPEAPKAVKSEAVISQPKAVQPIAPIIVAKENVIESPKAVVAPPTTGRAVVTVKEGVSKTGGFIRERIPAGWYVQVAAPRKLQEANDSAAKLKRAGYNVMIETARVRGEEYFRIIVGPDTNRADSEKVLTRLRRDNTIKGDPFVRAVK